MEDIIKKLSDIFTQFPTVGQRTAKRFVFYLTKLPKQKIDELLSAIQDLKDKIKLCKFCFNPHESALELCPICQDSGRDKTTICLVEKETDLISIESTKKYKGLYFILGGLLGFKKTEKDLRVDDLKKRLKNPENFGIEKINFSEIIIALNPTPEGQATTTLVEKSVREILPSPSVKLSKLARGLPSGGELEYADEETLESALEGRK